MTTMPWGKHKGEPMKAVLADDNYRRWLLQQDWLAEKFPAIRAALATDEDEPQPIGGDAGPSAGVEPEPRLPRGGRTTRFAYARVTNRRLGFVAKVRCLNCDREFEVPYGSEHAVVTAGNELIGLVGDCCAVRLQQQETAR